MEPALLGGLVLLALVDSTSFGTLLIPIWFLLTPGRVQVRRMLVFLGTVALFYLVVGLLLLAGATVVLTRAGEVTRSPAVAVVQLVVGAALLVGSFFIGRDRRGPGKGQPGRLVRWRDRAVGGDRTVGGYGSLVGLAVGAAVLELATMLPYLAAIGLLTTSELGAAPRAGVLAGYCAVMVLPALVLLLLRLVAHRQVEGLLRRVGVWLERTGAETSAWVVGIVGFLLARDALASVLGVLGVLEGWDG